MFPPLHNALVAATRRVRVFRRRRCGGDGDLLALKESISRQSLRFCTVLSWGRNAEGQAGVEAAVVVSRPTPILELHGASINALSAGKLHSSVVTADGAAHTWGDGRAGQLGLGSGDSSTAPSRVETLIGRASIVSSALGDSHSLFLDDKGQVWSCGDNKAGQLGLGTPLNVLASQHRRSLDTALRKLASLQQQHHVASSHQSLGFGGGRTSASSPAFSSSYTSSLSQSLRTLMLPEAPYGTTGSGSLSAFMQQASERVSSGGLGRSGGGVGALGVGGSVAWAFAGGSGSGEAAGATVEGARRALSFQGADVEGHLSAAGLREGIVSSPARIGRDLHPLARDAALLPHRSLLQPDAGHTRGEHRGGFRGAFGGLSQDFGELFAGLGSATGDAEFAGMCESSGGTPAGLASHHVVHVDTSRYFSVALTDRGELWTFGACMNGSLGTHNSWASSPQRVSGDLATLLSDQGGAVHVAAGGSFCVALTASGQAVVWGKLPGSRDSKRDLGSLLGASIGISAGDRVVAGVVPGLPPLRHVAAGLHHALLSDGERVWVIGRCRDASGNDTDVAHWSEPKEVLHLGGALGGVASLVCSARCSAVVTESGRLYMWGSLLDARHAQNLAPRSSLLRGVPAQDEACWQWAGFGADSPTLVEGVEGVKAVALGGWHAMALVH